MSETDSIVQFRIVPGWPDYRVGSDGSVWSKKGHRGYKPKVEKWKRMIPNPMRKTGHLKVMFSPGNVTMLVHRLVLISFVGEPPEGMQARHFPDRNPANNNLSNLSWGTHSQNMQDKTIHGTQMIGFKNPRTKLSKEDKAKICAEYVHKYGCAIRLAKKYGVSSAHIIRIAKNK